VSGLQTDLLTGFAVKIAGGSIGATWDQNGAYDVNATGIKLRKTPDKPDRLITLSAYGISDTASLPNSVIGLQVRSRWGGTDPRPADDLDDDVFGLLQEWAGTLSTGIQVALCRRVSGPQSLGQDGNGRWSVVSNYAVTAYWPTSHRV
jgi:hypothetical protein